MNRIIELVRDFKVLKEYKSSKAMVAWDDLRDAIEEEPKEANKLLELANDFVGNFKEFQALGYGVSPTDTRLILNEIMEDQEA